MSGLLAVGSYTSHTGGRGSGITLARADPGTGRLCEVVGELTTPSPSYLAAAGPTAPSRTPTRLVHAAHELAAGLVSTWRLDPDGTGEQLGEAPSGGAHPCHVAVHPSGRLLVVSNYGGTTGVLTVGGSPGGGPGAVERLVQVVEPAGRSGPAPDPDRQEGPHPHSAAFLDAGHVVVADLGTDELRVHAVVTDEAGTPVGLSPEPVQVVAAPPGSGPRTAVVHGGHLHVSGELDATVLTAAVLPASPTGPRLGPPRATRALAAPVPSGREQLSELAVVGEQLLVATRGVDVLTLLDVDGDGTPRAVTDVALGEVGAHNPRHVVAVGRHLYVSAQDADVVVHLPLRDGPAGRSSLEVGSPTCVLAL